MKIAILSANLGSFDKTKPPVKQDTKHEVTYHCFTDADFPPITGLTPRLQYRIPKLFGWEMFPGYDVYIWLDGAVSFERPDCVEWYLKQLGKNDMAFFKHPVRRNVRQEVEHIQKKLDENNWYIVPRYKNGLHKEMLEHSLKDKTYRDNHLYASTMFVYRNTAKVRHALEDWWFYQSRYYTCDQVNLPYVLHKHKIKVSKIDENLFKIGHLSLVSKHK